MGGAILHHIFSKLNLKMLQDLYLTIICIYTEINSTFWHPSTFYNKYIFNPALGDVCSHMWLTLVAKLTSSV